MKKHFLLLITSIFTISCLFAEDRFFENTGGKGQTIMFAESSLENGIFDKSDEWVKDKIRSNLISDMNRFGGFKCMDMNAAKSIIKIQKELESGVYDDSKSIEIGKMVKAKDIINIKTTRLSSGAYSINVTLFNVETGEILCVYSSPKTYESAEAYTLLAHYDCVSLLLYSLGVRLSSEGKTVLNEEKKTALAQAEKNKNLAVQNAKIEAERAEKLKEEMEQRARIEREEKAQREAKEKAEYEENQKALAKKRAAEAAAKAQAKKENPFSGCTFISNFENGSRYDTYIINFYSKTECTVTVKSLDSKGNENSFTKDGSYSFAEDVLSINVQMPNQNVRHVQKINWKSKINFKTKYSVFDILIPVSSVPDARKVRAEFRVK